MANQGQRLISWQALKHQNEFYDQSANAYGKEKPKRNGGHFGGLDNPNF